MATPSRIEVEVTLSPSSLARSLRDLADTIDPPGMPRGIQLPEGTFVPAEPDGAMVEKVARVLADRGGQSAYWQHYTDDARAVLAAIGETS